MKLINGDVLESHAEKFKGLFITKEEEKCPNAFLQVRISHIRSDIKTKKEREGRGGERWKRRGLGCLLSLKNPLLCSCDFFEETLTHSTLLPNSKLVCILVLLSPNMAIVSQKFQGFR